MILGGWEGRLHLQKILSHAVITTYAAPQKTLKMSNRTSNRIPRNNSAPKEANRRKCTANACGTVATFLVVLVPQNLYTLPNVLSSCNCTSIQTLAKELDFPIEGTLFWYLLLVLCTTTLYVLLLKLALIHTYLYYLRVKAWVGRTSSMARGSGGLGTYKFACLEACRCLVQRGREEQLESRQPVEALQVENNETEDAREVKWCRTQAEETWFDLRIVLLIQSFWVFVISFVLVPKGNQIGSNVVDIALPVATLISISVIGLAVTVWNDIASGGFEQVSICWKPTRYVVITTIGFPVLVIQNLQKLSVTIVAVLCLILKILYILFRPMRLEATVMIASNTDVRLNENPGGDARRRYLVLRSACTYTKAKERVDEGRKIFLASELAEDRDFMRGVRSSLLTYLVREVGPSLASRNYQVHTFIPSMASRDTNEYLDRQHPVFKVFWQVFEVVDSNDTGCFVEYADIRLRLHRLVSGPWHDHEFLDHLTSHPRLQACYQREEKGSSTHHVFYKLQVKAINSESSS